MAPTSLPVTNSDCMALPCDNDYIIFTMVYRCLGTEAVKIPMQGQCLVSSLDSFPFYLRHVSMGFGYLAVN